MQIKAGKGLFINAAGMKRQKESLYPVDVKSKKERRRKKRFFARPVSRKIFRKIKIFSKKSVAKAEKVSYYP